LIRFIQDHDKNGKQAICSWNQDKAADRSTELWGNYANQHIRQQNSDKWRLAHKMSRQIAAVFAHTPLLYRLIYDGIGWPPDFMNKSRVASHLAVAIPRHENRHDLRHEQNYL
jgi:hypothetical protein